MNQDEEKDALLKQFQALANESSNFDAERENMERSIRSQQQEVTTLQTELMTVRRRLGELEQLYSQQKTAGVQAEMQADDLLRRLGTLERDLRDARGDKVRTSILIMRVFICITYCFTRYDWNSNLGLLTTSNIDWKSNLKNFVLKLRKQIQQLIR